MLLGAALQDGRRDREKRKAPGLNKRITIYDIAERLGISTTTVYRALNDKPKVSMDTRNAVLEAAQEMGFKANTLARSLARKNIKIAVVAFTSFPEFHKCFLMGARDAHTELMDYNIQVEYFSYEQGDSNFSAGDRYLKELFENIAYGGYDGALICARECEQFKLLRDNQVTVATAINDVSPELRQFCVRYNGWVAGKIAAELLWWQMDRSKSVILASGASGPQQKGIHSEIERGFFEQLEVTPLKVACVYYNYDNASFAYEETNRVLELYPDIGGVYINSFNSSGILQSLREHGLLGKASVVTSDIYDELRACLADGSVSASIFQDQYNQGKIGLKTLFQSISEATEPEDTILIPPQIILRSNMDLFA